MSPDARTPALRTWTANALAAVATCAITCAALAILMRWDQARWDVPFEYEGDVLLMQMIVQNALEQPWYLDTPRLGAPHGLAMYDYPCADTLDVVLVKLIGLFDRRPAVVMNVLYVLGYPLAALAMLMAARWLGSRWPAAIAAGVLFAFLPFHATRGESHLFLTTYFPIPLIAAVLVHVAMGRLPFFPDTPDGRLRFRLTDRDTVRGAAIALLAGATNPYWSFFTLLLLTVAGLVDVLKRRRVWGALSAGLLAGLVVLSVTANMLPTLVYQHRHGKNPDAYQREPEEAEAYGLKLAHLLLPAPHHRADWAEDVRGFYKPDRRLLENENRSAALGIIGACGFLGLIAAALVPRPDRSPRTTALAGLNLGAVLIGTLGGLGLLVNLAFAHFRCYNRISVFIGCFALLMVAGWGDALLARCRRWPAYFAALIVLSGLVALGICDGASRHIRPDYAQLATSYEADAAFVRSVEDRLPPGSRVFQLPVVPFQSRAHHRLHNYELLVGYLHSQRLEWNFGAMVGRPASAWQADLGERLEKPDSMNAALADLTAAGFRALWIDWRGYSSEDRARLRLAFVQRLGEPFAARAEPDIECYRIAGE